MIAYVANKQLLENILTVQGGEIFFNKGYYLANLK
jgi:hypothetical protein